MAHILKDYIALLDRSGLLAAPIPREIDQTAPVALVSYDSREVVPGTLFLCKGAHFKPEFLEMAQERGALAYVSQVPYPQSDLPCLQVHDMRSAIAPLADLFYGHPSGKLKVIGLTGTKGKSSTAYYLKYILDEYMAEREKPESGIISSIDTYDGVERLSLIHIFAVGVHILTQQGDVLIALPRQLLHFLEDILRPPGPLPPPDIWHNAVGAEVVAPVHDGHPCLHLILADYRNALSDGTRLVSVGEDAAPLGQQGVDHLRNCLLYTSSWCHGPGPRRTGRSPGGGAGVGRGAFPPAVPPPPRTDLRAGSGSA